MLSLKRVDFWLFIPACILTFLGTLVLASVSASDFPEQFFHLFLAFGVFFIFASIDVSFWRGFAPLMYGFSVFLLGATFLLGSLTRGSVRWISFGPFNLQASEIIKPIFVVFFSWIVARGERNRFLYALLFGLPILFLILIQPDLGSAIVIGAGTIGVIFLGGVSLRLIIGLAVLFAAVLPLFWRFLVDYQKDRILSFLNPSLDPLGAGYNVLQSIIAVGSGGLWGRGLGQGTQSQLAFLPERHTDFIFAALGEELGFLGSVVVILCFMVILARIIFKASYLKDTFERSVLGGIFFVLFVQTVVNVGMNMGVLPITGVPLPFVSSGGSSLLAMSALLGMASSITKN